MEHQKSCGVACGTKKSTDSKPLPYSIRENYKFAGLAPGRLTFGTKAELLGLIPFSHTLISLCIIILTYLIVH
jgi:hypothetical protein